MAQHLPDEAELHTSHYRAIFSDWGAAIRSLTYNGELLSEPFGRWEAPPFSCNVVLAPWPNRVADGTYTWEGTQYQLELTEPQRANSIHGFAMGYRWIVDEVIQLEDQATARMSLSMPAQPGWPWPLELSLEATLTDASGLSVVYHVTNGGSSSCPWAFGVHTYLNACGAPLDQCALTVPVTEFQPLSVERKLPVGNRLPAWESGVDLAHGQDMNDVILDHAYVVSPSSQMRTVRLINRDGKGVELRTDPQCSWFQVYTADPRIDGGFPGRGRALAVEPMTCPPNALVTGEDLGALEPGETRSIGIELQAYSDTVNN